MVAISVADDESLSDGFKAPAPSQKRKAISVADDESLSDNFEAPAPSQKRKAIVWDNKPLSRDRMGLKANEGTCSMDGLGVLTARTTTQVTKFHLLIIPIRF